MIAFEQMQTAIAALAASFAATPSEQISLAQAVGRITACPVVAKLAIPRFNVSAMDGYALHSRSTAQQRMVIGQAIAGLAYSGDCPVDDCVRIFTGAAVPDGYDSVVMQENVAHTAPTEQAAYITINQAFKPGANIRLQGEELMPGDVLLAKGHIIQASDLMSLAAAGVHTLAVHGKIVVGVLSCGDELCDIGQPLGAEQIVDCNRIGLMAMLHTLPVTVIDYGIAVDDPIALKALLSKARSECDVLISSAGVSVGDYDYMQSVVAELGQVHQYKVAMKPGKPFVLGQLGSMLYFGLPGNPVSSFIGFTQLVAPALWQRCGLAATLQPFTFKAQLLASTAKKPGRMDFQRALITLSADPMPVWQVTPVGKGQDSHRIVALNQANGLMVLPTESTDKVAGDWVDVQLFSVHAPKPLGSED